MKKEHKLQSAKQLSCWRIHPASLRWLIIEMSAVRWKKSWEGGEREDENKKFKSGDARKVWGERRLRMRVGLGEGMQKTQWQKERTQIRFQCKSCDNFDLVCRCRHHCRLTICWIFFLVKQIQITIWWWDGHACPLDKPLHFKNLQGERFQR